jgi:hypothetical protein
MMRFEDIPFVDDADEVRTWKGLAISAIMDLRRYAHDAGPERRIVSAEAYEADAVRIEANITTGEKWISQQYAQELARQVDELETENARLRRIVEIVRVARQEGWYEDDSRWDEVDKGLVVDEQLEVVPLSYDCRHCGGRLGDHKPGCIADGQSRVTRDEVT